MSGFTITIKDLNLENLRLSKKAQSANVLRMKLWLHIERCLKEYKREESIDVLAEIADIQFSYNRYPKYELIEQMERITIELQ